MKKDLWYYIIIGQLLFFTLGAITVATIAIRNPPDVIKKVDMWK